jgi:4-oxalocrotonate tautomerase
MSGDVPDARAARGPEDASNPGSHQKEKPMFLIHVKLIEGVFTGPQKEELVERLTTALLTSAGEGMRRATWCLVEEIPGELWGVGGETVSLDDMRALAREEDPG